MASGLFASLPKPKYTGEHEEIPHHAQSKGPRIVGPGIIDESQIVLKRAAPPSDDQRTGWQLQSAEVLNAQRSPDTRRKTGTSKSNALAIQVDAEGKVKYDAIARQGHNKDRIIHSSFKDLIPLRQQANAGDLNLDRPDEEEVQASAAKTKAALDKLVSGAVASQKPKNVKGRTQEAPVYVRYTPADQMGDTSKKNDRILKIVQKQLDPMEPPKFKHKKIPRGPPSPPPPVMHSPPRKLTAEDQEMWKIPPAVSNWKNPKGYTVPLDKRMAADGRGSRDVTINDNFAKLAEALYTADRHAREEVRLRSQMQQQLAEKEKLAKENDLREMARKAREERAAAAAAASSSRRRRQSQSISRSRSRSRSSDDSDNSSDSSSRRQRSRRRERRRTRSRSVSGGSDSDNDPAARARIQARLERRQENERQLRQSRMGTERRLQQLAREQNRDISEKVALGLAKPTANKETMYDSRLFNQTSGFDSGFNEDNAYDKPLFAAQEAIQSIYRPRATEDYDEETGEQAAENELRRIQKGNRFEALGRVKDGQGFKGTELAKGRREEGPVVFEKDKDDVFGIDALIGEAKKEADARAGAGAGRADKDDKDDGAARGKKRYGLDHGSRGGSEDRERADRRKRMRADDYGSESEGSR